MHTKRIAHLDSTCICRGKKCSGCTVKCILAFGKSQHYCKDCRKQHYQENKESVKAKVNEYRSDNVEKVKESQKRSRQKNKEHIKEHSLNYYANHKNIILQRMKKDYPKIRDYAIEKAKRYAVNHPERIKATNKKHRQTHKEANAIRTSVRRTRITQVGGSYTLEQWLKLKEEYGYMCLKCRKKEPEITLTIDHVIPVVKGGSSNVENLQPLCRPCNCSKRDKIIDYRLSFKEGV